jgi:hypothetical protein
VPELVTELLSKLSGIIHYYNREDHRPSCPLLFFGKEDSVLCEPVYPNGLNVPRLLDVYRKKVLFDADDQYKLLCWTISQELDHETVKKYDKRFLCAALTVYSTLHRGLISEEEADLILLTVKKAQEGAINQSIDMKGAVSGAVNDRAAIIICIFIRIFYFVRDILKTLAFDDVEVLPKFDAYYYNEMFMEMEAMTVDQKLVLLEEIENMRLQ